MGTLLCCRILRLVYGRDALCPPSCICVYSVAEAQLRFLKHKGIGVPVLGANLTSTKFAHDTQVYLLGAVLAPAESVLCPEGALRPLNQSIVFERFGAWFYRCWQDLSQDPRGPPMTSAPSDKVTCCRSA